MLLNIPPSLLDEIHFKTKNGDIDADHISKVSSKIKPLKLYLKNYEKNNMSKLVIICYISKKLIYQFK